MLFVKPEGDVYSAVYRVLYRDNALVAHDRVSQALTPFETKLYRAREAAARQSFARCGDHYNTVVLGRATPSESGSDIDVYLMPAMQRAGIFPLGGYYRFGVNSGSMSVVESQAFTNSCLDAQTPSGRQIPALLVSQAIGDAPTEVHAFVSLASGLPVYVISHSGVWAIEGAHARFVMQAPPGTASQLSPPK